MRMTSLIRGDFITVVKKDIGTMSEKRKGKNVPRQSEVSVLEDDYMCPKSS